VTCSPENLTPAAWGRMKNGQLGPGSAGVPGGCLRMQGKKAEAAARAAVVQAKRIWLLSSLRIGPATELAKNVFLETGQIW
jgi:hypothetical protein